VEIHGSMMRIPSTAALRRYAEGGLPMKLTCWSIRAMLRAESSSRTSYVVGSGPPSCAHFISGARETEPESRMREDGNRDGLVSS
jgi:hypothetical protein